MAKTHVSLFQMNFLGATQLFPYCCCCCCCCSKRNSRSINQPSSYPTPAHNQFVIGSIKVNHNETRTPQVKCAFWTPINACLSKLQVISILLANIRFITDHLLLIVLLLLLRGWKKNSSKTSHHFENENLQFCFRSNNNKSFNVGMFLLSYGYCWKLWWKVVFSVVFFCVR